MKKKETIKNLIDTKKGLTKDILADKLGISKPIMSSILNGSFGRLSVKDAIKIANFFKLEVEDINWRPN